MPNKRAKGKKIVGAWVDEKVIAALDELAAQHKASRADVVKAILTKGLLDESVNRKHRRGSASEDRGNGKAGE